MVPNPAGEDGNEEAAGIVVNPCIYPKEVVNGELQVKFTEAPCE